MFVVASVGMVAACVTTFIQEQLDPSLLYTLLVLFMIVCGASTLGFIGIALSAVVETTHPVSPELSGGTVELFVQIFGAFFSEGGVVLGERAFFFCGVAVWLVTIILLLCYKQEYRKSLQVSGGSQHGHYSSLARESQSAGGGQQHDAAGTTVAAAAAGAAAMVSGDKSSSLLASPTTVSLQR